jgi:large subunit ribosomal protein L19
MPNVMEQVEAKYKKKAVPLLRSGDTVKVHQRIVEGGKTRVQVFEGLVIRVTRKNSLSASFTVRRIASGVGVEKTYLMHSPSITKVDITKRTKVRRNYLSYMRGLTGKSSRLSGVEFDRDAVNVAEEEGEAEEAKIHEEQLESYDPEAAKKEKEAEKAEAQAATALEMQKTEADKLEEKPKEKPSAKNPAEEPNKQK